MPPSPTRSYFSGRELRGDNFHKRGHSLDGGILFRERDDDLALFNEMHTKRDNFLLQSNDDFEGIFSTKLTYFSDYKLGISIPGRAESSNLLTADGEKNDYDWLLTPPDTPLFPSLDDEASPVALTQRGKPLSQPIAISRSSIMEKSHRSSRGRASPNRLSPSPRSGNSTFQTRGRPSSAPQSSPAPTLNHAIKSWRPSPPPSKPSTPVPRSLTPTPQRMSKESSGPVSSSGVRGTSPVYTNRGNSASQKVRAWKNTVPGFSLDAPPNLRTSLADRPVSYTRGSSPASNRSVRQSMSPTASRSVSSSHSHDRDRLSSHSKGSVASSGDDDVDSLQSVPTSSSERSVSRKVGAFPSNKAPSLFKKPNRTGLSSSAPKRSFDSALQQMDHRKGPQNRFRPLLSSVPSSTVYAGKNGAVHRALISRNTSVTTSSNAGSDQGTSGSHGVEGSDQNRDDMANECGKVLYPDVEDGISAFDKVDAVNEDIHDRLPNVHDRVDCQLGTSEIFDYHSINMATTSTCAVFEVKHNFPEVNSIPNMVLCAICGCRYHTMDLSAGDLELCTDCRRLDEPLTATSPMPTIRVHENSPSSLMEISDGHVQADTVYTLLAIAESSEVTNSTEARASQHEENVQEGYRIGDPEVQTMRSFSNCLNFEPDISDGAGISLLLSRSSSGKGPIVQGRTFTATSIAYGIPSYVRDDAPTMRNSLECSSLSASSSVNLGSTRQIESQVQWQLSGRKSGTCDMTNTKHQCSGSSFSGNSSHAFEGLGCATSVAHVENDAVGLTSVAPSESPGLCDTCSDVVYDCHYGTMAASMAELSTTTLDICSGDSSVASFSNLEDCGSYGNFENFQNDARSIPGREMSASPSEVSPVKDNVMLTPVVDRVDFAGITTQSSLDAISEIEIEIDHLDSPDSYSDVGSQNSRNTMDEVPEPSVSATCDKGATASVANPDTFDHVHGFLEESTVTVEGYCRTKSRSLTLEEATDTILFCSSIVHNLAKESATIAIEKQKLVPLEGSKPTVAILGSSNYDRKDPRGRTGGKRSSKSQKTRQSRVETDTSNTENDEKADASTTHIVGVPNKGDSMKPPKLESKCNCTIM